MSAEAERVVEDAKTVIERLRAEQGAQAERGLSALLLHECGALEEVNGEEPAAARDFLAAFNLDPQFREPLEALVRILTRRKSVKNLGKLLEALTRAASTPEERSRALVSRAAFLQDFEPDLAAARDCLEEAVSEAPEDPLLWLELELVYAKSGDAEGRQRALEARAELALDPTWKALLYIDLAGLVADAGDAGRAYELLDAASALDGRGRYAARKALAAIATRFEGAADLARALESQGDLIADALESPAQGDATGVPRSERTAAHAADAWLRAASVRARVDGPTESLALVERAAALLPGSAALARTRLAALEAAGDTRAVHLARELAMGSPPSKGSAALWLRVAEASRAAHDVTAAEAELGKALEADATSLPARALRMELLSDGRDAKALALALEAAALGYSAEEARGRGLFLAAFVWASQVGDATAAKDALSRGAGLFGTPGDGARVARTLAALAGDGAWYEESTLALLSHGAREEERAALWLELARARLLRGDDAGGAEALLSLAAEPGGAWLGRTLEAYAVGLTETNAGPLDPAALDALAAAESDPDLARAFSMGAALRRARSGDAVKAQQKLRALHDADAGDEATALLLAELERRGGDVLAAAGTLAACAAATDDVELGAALHLEAGILLFRAGRRTQAIEEMEAAQAGAPKAAATVLSWALRGAEPDTKQGRLRALEIATEAGADPIVGALERFGLEVALGGPDAEPADATTALETLEARSWGDLAVAGALGRLTLPVAAEDRVALDTALERLDALGGAAAQIAWAERFRTARTLDQDRAASVTAAARWADVDGGAHVAAEWLAASFAAEDRESEVAARRRLAEALDGDLAPALFSAAAAVSSLDHTGPHEPLVKRDGPASRLMNLELAPPGCDPRRRSVALRALDADDLGTESYIDALSLAAWSDLAAGASEQARDAFRSIVEARPDDIASWEGLRAASESLGEVVAEALACAEIGALSVSDERGAEHWERAGTLLLEKTDAKDRAIVAFERAFERDPRRAVSFDKLFRHVRAAGQNDALLAIVARRLDVAEDETELAKLYWERARALRNKGDADAALAALEDVTMLEPEHVGALALAGEIQIKKGEFVKAAPLLAQLAGISGAPAQQRLMSGVMAADLYEKRLGAPKDALRVLVELHRGGLATMAVRERLAALAAKNGDWAEATRCLEELMGDRETKAGRIEAARLAMAIWRDKVGQPARALNAVTRLLDESPDDPEAVELLLSNDVDASLRKRLVERARTTLLASLARDPTDAPRVALLAKVASHGSDSALRQATLGTLVALGRDEAAVLDELDRLDGRVAARPEIRLDASTLAEISDPEDRGPLAELFELMAGTIALALGPSLVSIGVTKKERIDARGGHPLRLAVASWLGALGIDGDFELYVGGREPKGVYGIPGDEPTIVLGPGVTTPLDPMTRSALAREVFALRRGISSVRSRDDATIASIVVAACQEVKVPVQQPPFAVFAEVSRGIHKEIPRRVRNSIGEICQRVVSSGADSKAWAAAARRSIDRMAVIGAGDASLVVADLLGVERARLGGAAAESERARRLLTFVLSPQYLEIRRKLGMGVR